MKLLLFLLLPMLSFPGNSLNYFPSWKSFFPIEKNESVQVLIPGQSTVLKFTSVPENGRQEISLRFKKSGTYSLVLSSANPPFSDHWLIWDCINLKSGNEIVWRIGEDETPPDYSNTPFDEFCLNTKCKTEFKVGTTLISDFPKELNDHSINEVKITFEIDAQHLDKNLQLELSTLFSTHSKVDNFKMRIALKSV